MNSVKRSIIHVMIATLTTTIQFTINGCGNSVHVLGPSENNVCMVPRGKVIYLEGRTWIAALLINNQQPARGKLGRDSAEYEWCYSEGYNMIKDKDPKVIYGKGKTTGGHPWITVGPIKVKWSYRSGDSGWIYTDVDASIDVTVSEHTTLIKGLLEGVIEGVSPMK